MTDDYKRELRHNVSTYRKYRCRCVVCRAANTAAIKRYRARIAPKKVYKLRGNRFTLDQILDQCLPNNECLEWTGGLDTGGYARIYTQGKSQVGHRYVLKLATGINPGRNTYACHTCDNRKCLNPEHLYWGTPLDNINDKINRGRDFYKNKTHCLRGHEYTAANTIVKSNGNRECRACRSKRMKAKYA